VAGIRADVTISGIELDPVVVSPLNRIPEGDSLVTLAYRPTPSDLEQFHRDGFFIVPRFLNPEETDLLRTIARKDHALQAAAASRGDGEGGAVKLTVDNELGDDIYSAIVRSERTVRTMEACLGGEVYHYHHKMILKEPKVGGAWAWHQDYGYWYHNGCLAPLLASCFIAVDKATRDNGCLQVLRGSHHYGRMEHGKVGAGASDDQTGADMERVTAAIERLELVHVELEPGSAVVFHCNLLHRSDQNKSDLPRWAFICCYNARRNDPYKESRHPRYSALEVWPDDRVSAVARQQLSRLPP
jgi:hypothetical protein